MSGTWLVNPNSLPAGRAVLFNGSYDENPGKRGRKRRRSSGARYRRNAWPGAPRRHRRAARLGWKRGHKGVRRRRKSGRKASRKASKPRKTRKHRMKRGNQRRRGSIAHLARKARLGGWRGDPLEKLMSKLRTSTTANPRGRRRRYRRNAWPGAPRRHRRAAKLGWRRGHKGVRRRRKSGHQRRRSRAMAYAENPAPRRRRRRRARFAMAAENPSKRRRRRRVARYSRNPSTTGILGMFSLPSFSSYGGGWKNTAVGALTTVGGAATTSVIGWGVEQLLKKVPQIKDERVKDAIRIGAKLGLGVGASLLVARATKSSTRGAQFRVGVYAATAFDVIGTVWKYWNRSKSGVAISGSVSPPLTPVNVAANLLGLGQLSQAHFESKLLQAINTSGELTIAESTDGEVALLDGDSRIIVRGSRAAMKGCLDGLSQVAFVSGDDEINQPLGEDMTVEQ